MLRLAASLARPRPEMVAWWQVVVTLVCILLSGTFSGLTLGLLSLDLIDLHVLQESGTPKERWCARRILPVRQHGNWLLCTLLIGNTAVNSALAIVTADLFGGVAGFVSSTMAILYIGEIIPQAVCHRFGLQIGAYAIPFVKVFMFLTAPLSFTTAKAIDFLLGGETGTRYNKSQLKSLLSIHGRPARSVQPDASSANRSADDSPDIESYQGDPVVVTERNQENVTIVELQQISSASSPRLLNPRTSGSVALGPSPHDRDRVSNKSIEAHDSVTPAPGSNPPPAAEGHPNHTSTDGPTGVDTSRARSGPLSKLYGFRRSRNGDKAARKEKDREKKERESESSNPPLTKDEIAILGGTFDFSQKSVAQVMTALDDVFMLEASLSLNFEVLLLIFQSGHSRVPVYDKTRDNIIGLLFAKDLILLDPEDSVPIKTVLLFFNRTVLLVFYDTPLNKMLNIFKQGGGHMAIVQQNGDQKPGEDPVPDTLGVVTLEDLIEELIGQDIVDETDVYTDNISKKRVKRVRSIDPEILKMFDSKHHEELLSEKEVKVVASYLSNDTEVFAERVVKPEVLKAILAELPIVEFHDEVKKKGLSNQLGLAGLPALSSSSANGGSDKEGSDASDEDSPGDGVTSHTELSFKSGLAGNDAAPMRGIGDTPGENEVPNYTVYTRGVPTKNAVLIINGKLEISAGSDGFISDVGPWTLLGINALTDDLYAPDFTARVTEYPTRLLRIPRRLYRLMLRYSGTTEAGVGGGAGSGGAGVDTGVDTEVDAAGGKRRRASEARSSSSLALAAAAAAVAVGKPRRADGRPPMPGTASDASIVKRTRTRPNGQSIEWSEMEPLGLAGERGAGAGSGAGSGALPPSGRGRGAGAPGDGAGG